MQKYPSTITLLVIAGLLVFAGVLASCAPDTSAPEFNREAARVEAADNQASSDTALAGVSETTTTVALVEFTDQACLDCHTDEGRLKELAVEEEDIGESLSEGPG